MNGITVASGDPQPRPGAHSAKHWSDITFEELQSKQTGAYTLQIAPKWPKCSKNNPGENSNYLEALLLKHFRLYLYALRSRTGSCSLLQHPIVLCFSPSMAGR